MSTAAFRADAISGRVPSRIVRLLGGCRKRSLSAGLLLLGLLLLGLLGAPRAGGAQDRAAAEVDGAASEWVEETLARLSLEEKAAQLITVWTLGGYASSSSEEFRRLAGLVERGIGGLVISVGLPHEYAARLNALQRRADVPLLVAADFESGGPSFRMGGIYALPYVLDLGGGTELPPTMAFGAIGDERFAHRLGRITGLEARAVGVHIALAPVLDVNSNPENPIINTRSFGEDPERVARLGRAFILGARSAELMTTGKHFPGHGDTRSDSHLDLPAVPADRARLDAVELIPFRAAVEAGVDAILTAHVAVPGILGPGSPPATLSPYFLTDVLREEMGFEGLVYTEAMDMGAVVNRYGEGAAVRALEAGADIILMPPDPEATIRTIVAAVESGRLSEDRLDASVRRVLEAKARAGLDRERLVELERVAEVVASAEHRAFADSAAARSLVLARDRDRLVPLADLGAKRVLGVTFARRADLAAGRAFDRLLGQEAARLERIRFDYESPPAAYDAARSSLETADLVILSAYLSPLEGSGTISLPAGVVHLVEAARAWNKPLVVLSFGNPYLLDLFPGVGTYLLAWGGREVSQRAAARALTGRAPIGGRLPISLPPHHALDEGLDRRRRPRR